MKLKPHRLRDRHGVEICACGWMAPGANASLLSPSVDRAYTLLREHITRNDDHLCHWQKYGMDCHLTDGHDSIHRQ